VNRRPLGRTGLTVSALSFGTVSLGVDYGIHAPGAFGPPPEDDAVALLQAAAAAGVTFFDTAPAYGDAERIVGRAFAGNADVVLATKVAVPPQSRETASRTIDASLEASRRALRRDVIDVLQLHNATPAMMDAGEITDALVGARQRGHVRAIGASVYGEEAALAVLAAGVYDVLQVALSVLDQRMLTTVIPHAARDGVGVIVRSAFLKGALTPKAPFLPAELSALRASAVRARDRLAGGSWEELPAAALRYCLSIAGVSSVLCGARTRVELGAAVAAEAAGALDPHAQAAAAQLALDDDRLLNPSHWPIP
jgi:aryl-alcohol dehydrogenase-like predicted oxidoreductase